MTRLASELSAFRLAMLDCVGPWFAGWKGEACELADPKGRATGELQRFGGHYSLSLDGLSPGQVERVMRVLRREGR